jgi:hypothetical protein
VLLFGSLLCSPAVADEPPRVDDAHDASATIVLIGEAAESDELRELFVELLGRTSAIVRFLQKAEFRRQDLLGASEDDAVHVFVVATQSRAKLYFRGPAGQRFLLREVPLQRGLDELGRELVGQIVASSIDALIHRAAGITREQVQLELDRQSPEHAEAPAPHASSEPSPVPASRAAPGPRPPWEGWTSLRYSATFSGDPGLGHGPGLELGLAARVGVLLRGRLMAERWFARSVETVGIGADIATTRARLAFDLGLGLGDATLVLSLGAGLDWAKVVPRRAHDSRWELATPSRHRAPGASGELRLEIGGGSWQLALGAVADALLADTHYDVEDHGRLVRVAEEWQLRPGVVVALGVRPRL